ncbi:MAG: SDR family NAD(P)-dependent oxidoreductase [Kiritimatiellae bacterium]|nr:SDR family NAD(P)-dependent oxidoreductase [Kiritimatiellia bacterium]
MGRLADNILITGASSGIGAALAVECARRGAKALFLCGRDAARLETVAAECRAAGTAEVRAEIVDVTDEGAVSRWMAACDAAFPLGLVFANAGRGTGRESAENVRATFALNVGGVVNTVLPAIELYRARKAGGQIVITASIAGYAPLPGCPSYAATKAGMKSWGLSLRGFLRPEGIRVNVVCPGFVRSRLTDRNTCPMPFFMEAPKAARIILDRVERNVGLIAFPWPMRLAVWGMSLLPWRLAEFIGSLLPAKNADNTQGITL